MGGILLLGEGNFTFSHDLIKVLIDSPFIEGNERIVTTSFDERPDLCKKYSSAEKILSGLNTFDHVKVINGIDATKNLKSQLLLNSCLEIEFDHIIFNFPHLGYEDLKAHSSLVAHILYRANELLSSCSPRASFYLSLTQSQAENWNLNEMASRNDMVCYDMVHFQPQLWPTYELKRHHSGKSFSTRVQRCIHFCFRKRIPTSPEHLCDDSALDFNLLEKEERDVVKDRLNLFRHLHRTKAKVIETTVDISDSTSAARSESTSISTKMVEVSLDREAANDCKRPLRKRKVDDLVKGNYMRVQTPIATPESGVTSLMSQEDFWECKLCTRQFKSEQGVKTHVYVHHVIRETRKDGGFDTDSMTVLSCDICQKVLPNHDALYQHNIAKHSGQFQSIKPSWAATAQTSETSNDGQTLLLRHECNICGLLFLTFDELECHLLGWRPISLPMTFFCLHCQKSFRDDRSLKQHMNYCTISAKSLHKKIES